MKRIKRTLAALLTVVLTLALLGEAVFADNSEQPVWPEEGAIQLSKSAAAAPVIPSTKPKAVLRASTSFTNGSGATVAAKNAESFSSKYCTPNFRNGRIQAAKMVSVPRTPTDCFSTPAPARMVSAASDIMLPTTGIAPPMAERVIRRVRLSADEAKAPDRVR